jgi:membrane associated rhomboid family serine protease
MSNFDTPPQDNPILTAYESYQKDTPFITRTIMSAQAVSYVVNIFFDSSFAFANKPVFTIYKYEVYRIITSLFICSSFFSLIFAYFSFVPVGKRLELSTGSTEFACNFLTIGVLTNVLYLVVTVLLDTLVAGQYWLILPSFGLWNSLFGLIAMECTRAPQGSMRKVLFFTVPTIYYPLALWIIFTLMSGFSLSLAHLISIGLGYAFGYGYLDQLNISKSRCKIWEEKYLENLITSQEMNFVISSTAMGSGAWSEETGGDSSVSGESIFSRWTSQMQQTQQQPGSRPDVAMGSDDNSTPGAPRPGRVIKSNDSMQTSSALPTSGGQQLGGRSRRQNTDPREARLQAIERRMFSVDDGNQRDR